MQNHRLNPSATSSSLYSSHLIPSASNSTALATPTNSDDAPLSPTTPHGALYKFTTVTSGEVPQADFFEKTTLPLVRDFLHGDNCLLFAYGTTGSGKTYTVQGRSGEEAGLLPRVMDVVWTSLKGKESKYNVS